MATIPVELDLALHRSLPGLLRNLRNLLRNPCAYAVGEQFQKTQKTMFGKMSGKNGKKMPTPIESSLELGGNGWAHTVCPEGSPCMLTFIKDFSKSFFLGPEYFGIANTF